jgi:hypothetical protein
MDGTLYSSDSDIRAKAVQFYESLYTEKEAWRPFADDLSFSMIGELDRNLLGVVLRMMKLRRLLRTSKGINL